MNAIRLRLSELGFCVFRINVGSGRTVDGRYFKTGVPRGFSDLVAVKDGRVFFIEVKVKPNRPTKEQLNFIEQMKCRYGAAAGVAYSVEEAERICMI